MRIRWLGWAGVEIESGGEAVVIDPLQSPEAVFAPFGDGAADAGLPALAELARPGAAVAALVTHLHRDHADADALVRALAPSGFVAHPAPVEGGEGDDLGLAQADAELAASGLERREVVAWQQLDAGPFSLTALPAVDGLGDPQVAWLVEVDGHRLLHLGDTVFHGYWWRMAHRHGPFDVVFAPVNGPVVRFPHRRPSSSLAVAMDPEQAALAGELLGAGVVVPMHGEGFDVDPWYRPVADPIPRFQMAAAGRPFEARVLEVGGTLEL